MNLGLSMSVIHSLIFQGRERVKREASKLSVKSPTSHLLQNCAGVGSWVTSLCCVSSPGADSQAHGGHQCTESPPSRHIKMEETAGMTPCTEGGKVGKRRERERDCYFSTLLSPLLLSDPITYKNIHKLDLVLKEAQRSPHSQPCSHGCAWEWG